MTDLDRASLDRLLPSASGAADWGDVLSRSGMHQRRRVLVAVVAAVALVVVGTASAFAVRTLFLDKGFIGLPPVGATPSAPEHGDLVLHYFGPAQAGPGPKIRVWVYADGRLISLGGEAVPEGANALSTGFLEQHLTPEGVELLRREILSIAGEFGDEPPPPAPPPPCAKGQSSADGSCAPPTPPPPPNEPIEVPFYMFIEVTNVGRLLRVERAGDLDRLVARIADPTSWLPASAWANSEVKAYVSSKYAVCYGGWPPDQQVDRSRALALLPTSARDLLGGDTASRQGPLFGEPGNFRPSFEYCLDMTTEEARALTVALDDAGLQRQGALRLNYQVEAAGPSRETVFVYFEPYLPHGEFTCSACG